MTVFTLLEDKELEEVTEIIQSTLSTCKTATPINVSLKGLSIIKGTIESCQVLYANLIQGKEQQLDALAKAIMTELVRSGHASHLSVKWHCTLMNCRYDSNKRTFNAAKILDELGDFEFGQVTITEMQLSTFSNKTLSDGYYWPVKIFQL